MKLMHAARAKETLARRRAVVLASTDSARSTRRAAPTEPERTNRGGVSRPRLSWPDEQRREIMDAFVARDRDFPHGNARYRR